MAGKGRRQRRLSHRAMAKGPEYCKVRDPHGILVSDQITTHNKTTAVCTLSLSSSLHSSIPLRRSSSLWALQCAVSALGQRAIRASGVHQNKARAFKSFLVFTCDQRAL